MSISMKTDIGPKEIRLDLPSGCKLRTPRRSGKYTLASNYLFNMVMAVMTICCCAKHLIHNFLINTHAQSCVVNIIPIIYKDKEN